MANYTYEAIDQDGRKKTGKMEAPNKDDVVSVLTKKGLTVINIGGTSVFGEDVNIPFLHKKVNVRDLSVFCRQMATNIEAGVTIINALDIVEHQTENKTFKKVLTDIRISIEKGSSFAEALARHDQIFGTLFVNMIAAGESSGNLEKSLYQMAVHYEKAHKIRSLVKKAMVYPIIVGIVSLVVMFVMLVFIVPSFMTMFDDMDIKMPTYTLIVVAISNFLVHYWYIMAAAIFILIFILKILARTDKGVYVVANLKLKMPIFGKLTLKTNCAQFSRNLSTLIAAGVPLINALEIVARTMTNQYFTDALRDCKDQIARGIPLSEPLRNSELFPPMVYNMVSIGEETGALEQMLDKSAEYYEEEVETTTAQLSAMLEPMLILLMAGIVIAIIAAVFAPMLSMYSQLSDL